ncbi:MAG: phosphoenolpyruvate--protein phosphotransferase [Lentisphaerae bacterium RIFOXYA12_64_32]|nr:MAG: phosphoenolpyruvate--protein phosphotransferase [Lentisphaerae bacterium RIFOXYA12_64_32]
MHLSGSGVSAGIVIGKALLIRRELPPVVEVELTPAQVPAEIRRFKRALVASEKQLVALRDRVGEIIGAKEASIFDAHLMLVADQVLGREVIATIESKRRNAEYVFAQVIEHYGKALREVRDDYIRDRLTDVQDVAARVIRNLQGREHVDLSKLDEPAIIVAHDLSPSDTAGMDRHHVLGFITSIGTRTSHTAIMGRSLRIPAVVGVAKAEIQIAQGDPLIVDGTRGVVIVHPTEEELRDYRKRIRIQARWFERIQAEANLPTETIDGFRVQLAANIELPEEVETVKQVAGVGIGLFRSEFLFIRQATLPDEEEQLEAYRAVVQEMYPQSVIIRTLDIGGDKFLSHLDTPEELNPFLGMRAIRFCLSRPDIFMSQLRAILRASAFGKVRIMFPMVSTLDELLEALDYLRQAERDLDRKGIHYNRHLDVGTMIEVPAAAVLADKLAPYVDFFSLGTNDLVQYSLAADRANPDIAYLYQPTNPAIIRLIRMTVEAAYSHAKWVGICGEMASEPLLVPLVLGLGINELSMSPVAVGLVKRLIRRIRMYEAEQLVEQAVGCETAGQVRALCEQFIQRVAPDVLQG